MHGNILIDDERGRRFNYLFLCSIFSKSGSRFSDLALKELFGRPLVLLRAPGCAQATDDVSAFQTVGHMSFTGLDVFDRSLQTTHIWLDELQERLAIDKHGAWRVLGVVLRTLRDRLPLGLAAHLGAQLPLVIRGAYYDQWRPSELPEKWRTREEFLAPISEGIKQTTTANPAAAASAVFQALNHFVDPGQVANVRQALPEDIRELWPETNVVAPED